MAWKNLQKSGQNGDVTSDDTAHRIGRNRQYQHESFQSETIIII